MISKKIIVMGKEQCRCLLILHNYAILINNLIANIYITYIV